MDNNNNINHRAYAYDAHETEICHDGRLGCWVKPESVKDRVVGWVRCALECIAFAFMMFGIYALCAL